MSMTTGKRLLQKIAPYNKMIKGVAHQYRVAILYLLANEPMWGEDLARHLRIKENLLMHHLNAMVAAGWLTKQREGRHVVYRLRPRTFKEVPEFLSETPFWKELEKKSAK